VWYIVKHQFDNEEGQRPRYRTEQVEEALADFDTVEDFWATYQHLLKPDDIHSKACYHVFQTGIKPMWEDEANKDGGRWHVWLPKGFTNKLWEDLLLYLIGSNSEHSENICGIEVRTKLRGDSLSLWHKNADDENEKEGVRNDFLKAIGAEGSDLKLEYHKFTDSLAFERQNKAKKNSGFQRNLVKDENENTSN